MTKITIEKLPEGVKVTLHYDAAKRPLVVVLQPAELQVLVSVLQTAARSDSFRFEYQS